jgi:hypothetical protein
MGHDSVRLDGQMRHTFLFFSLFFSFTLSLVIDWFIVDTPGVSEVSAKAKAKVKVKERKKKQTLDELTVLRDTYRVYTYRQTLTDGESGRRTGMALEDFLFFLFRCCYLLLWKSVLFLFFFFFSSFFFS